MTLLNGMPEAISSVQSLCRPIEPRKIFSRRKQQIRMVRILWEVEGKKGVTAITPISRIRFNGDAPAVIWSGSPLTMQTNVYRWCSGEISERMQRLPFRVFRVKEPWCFFLSSLQ